MKANEIKMCKKLFFCIIKLQNVHENFKCNGHKYQLFIAYTGFEAHFYDNNLFKKIILCKKLLNLSFPNKPFIYQADKIYI